MSSVSKKVKITFWVSTILVALMTIPSVFMANAPGSLEAFNHLGVGADWFRWELEIAKTIAGVVLVLPFIRGKIKEWAYVGLGIDFISAFIAFWAVDGFANAWFILPFIVILWLSYWSYHKISDQKMRLI